MVGSPTHYLSQLVLLIGSREVEGMDDFSTWEFVITRKDHFCNGCFVKIPKGTRTMNGHGKFQGDIFNCYLCDDCNDFLDRNRDVMEEGFCDGDIGMARKDEEYHNSLREQTTS